jgi:hypothetical protein
MWGGDYNGGDAKYAALSNQISENQNANLIMDGIKGNTTAIG